MATLIPTRAAGWLAQRFELSRGGSGGNVRAMEGLRGFAVFLVFLVHFATLSDPWVQAGGWVAYALGKSHAIGHAGVDLFFVLSGYLIYGHLISSQQSFGRYAGRRIRRIYPAFLAMLVIYVLASVLRPAASKFPAGIGASALYLLENLLLLPGLLPIEPIITVAWSLSYEAFYYLLIPAVVALLGLRHWSALRRFMLFVGATAVLLAGFAMWGGPVRLVMFLAGILLHDLLATQRLARPGAVVAGVAFVSALAAMMLPWVQPTGQAARVAVLTVGFFLMCYHLFVCTDSAWSRFFGWTPLRWLGNMSYSYYLAHGLALKILFTALAKLSPPQAGADCALWFFVPAFLWTLLPSALLFLCVERPFSLAPMVARARPLGVVRP